MNEIERLEILIKANTFFKDTIAINHVKNTKKLKSLSKFNVNPFLDLYLANFLTGNGDAESIAKALIYPRVLGTSITTSFGTHIQSFCSDVLSGFGSAISGIDIEFIDQIDGRKKYCQIKAGPNTINKDDVKTLIDHFKELKGIARINKLDIRFDDLIIGVLYGTPNQVSSHYKKVKEEHPVVVGQEFWHRLTGHNDFYADLIAVIGKVALDVDGSEVVDKAISDLAKEIKSKYNL